MDKDKPKIRCKNGERRDPVTGECIKMTEELLKHKQALRNKKKGVNKDDKGNILRPKQKFSSKKNALLPSDSQPIISEELIELSVKNPPNIPISLS